MIPQQMDSAKRVEIRSLRTHVLQQIVAIEWSHVFKNFPGSDKVYLYLGRAKIDPSTEIWANPEHGGEELSCINQNGQELLKTNYQILNQAATSYWIKIIDLELPRNLFSVHMPNGQKQLWLFVCYLLRRNQRTHSHVTRVQTQPLYRNAEQAFAYLEELRAYNAGEDPPPEVLAHHPTFQSRTSATATPQTSSTSSSSDHTSAPPSKRPARGNLKSLLEASFNFKKSHQPDQSFGDNLTTTDPPLGATFDVALAQEVAALQNFHEGVQKLAFGLRNEGGRLCKGWSSSTLAGLDAVLRNTTLEDNPGGNGKRKAREDDEDRDGEPSTEK